jgi:hypothetical protein
MELRKYFCWRCVSDAIEKERTSNDYPKNSFRDVL